MREPLSLRMTRIARYNTAVASTEAAKTDAEALPPEWPKAKLIDVSGNYVPILDQNLPKYGN